MPAPALVKPDWQKKHVYLITYPRCRTLPNLSPWSLKLETWLRMADIPFTNINNEFKMFSVKGQVPFVELDGRQIADSSIIINDLTKEFGKTDMEPTDPKEKAIACAFSALAEEHLTWAIFAMRGKTGFEFIYSDDGYGRYHGTGWMRSIFQYFMQGRVKELTLGRANAQGMGRHSLDELNVMAEESLKAMSAFLGDKPYFGGDKPITLDATMFGHLCGLVYMPTHEGYLTKCMKETYPNLGQFVERIKEKYWPDWEETCRSMDMNVHNKKD